MRSSDIGDMDDVIYRPAIPADTDAVARYHDACFRATYAAHIAAGHFGAPDYEGTRQQLFDWFQLGSEFRTQVAVATDTPVGHFTVKDHQLVHLFVEPARQGTGLGRHMLALAETALAAEGHDEFELHTRVENLHAISFYKKAGWVLTDQLVHTVEHGIDYHEHVMIKRPA